VIKLLEIKTGNNKFYIDEENSLIGEITYFEDKNSNLVVDHTYVDPNYRGHQLAQKLVERMVEYAREVKKPIIPVCPYVLKVFQKNDSYHDIWNQDQNDYDVACKI
jgi:predicted GNAT family acetyltransferase